METEVPQVWGKECEGIRQEGVNFLQRDGGKQFSLDISLLPGHSKSLLDSCSAVCPSLPVVIHHFNGSLFEAKIAKG